ncbi:ankyrin repeat domain-containing protein [Reyranella sp.]|uniref:ankyrin repeat domain-containing protein n=1 Tax=Reyranella sp. TaxID=1929291 RepID=UPI0025EC6239|nr:ankyrin repeat domain-containing protein [Reyranella sp.]
MIRRAFVCGFVASLAALPAGTVFAQTDIFAPKPIVKAVLEGDEEKVRQALLKNENPNQTANNGTPLLIVAVQSGSIPVVETLLKGGAIVDSIDRENYTALMRATEKNDVDIVEILLRRNASTRPQNRQGQTALMIASGRGYADIVKLLLDKKADPNMRDFTGRSALGYAKQNNRGAVDAMLRRAGGKE